MSGGFWRRVWPGWWRSETPARAVVREEFEEWGVLDIRGYHKIAGLMSVRTIGKANFIQVDVPGPKNNFTGKRIYSIASIFCIALTSEREARRAAQTFGLPAVIPDLLDSPRKLVREPEDAAV